MSFDHILLVFFLFVLLPEFIRKVTFGKYGTTIAILDKWPDVKKLLDIAFGRVPQFQYNAQAALALAMIFTYLALKADPDSLASWLMYVLSLALFAYLAHLFSDELFDTFWNSVISLFSFFVL